MSNDYEEFIKYVFYEHIQKSLTNVQERWHLHFEHEFEHRLLRLTRATRALRFIKDYAENDEDINRSFTLEMVKETIRSVRYGVQMNNELVVDTGIADVIQDYFGEIVDGMSVDHFPKEDFEVLQQAGSSDSRREIIALVYLIKSRKEQLIRESRQVRFSQTLGEVAQRVERIENTFPQEPPNPNQSNKKPAVKRATFKGIGSIAQGALMTMTNITLAAGLWSVPLPPETTSLGAVVSATTGIGTILTGIGELRGE